MSGRRPVVVALGAVDPGAGRRRPRRGRRLRGQPGPEDLAGAEGMYRPLGSGDVDVPAIVGSLRARGYTGWYVLEQDTILTEEPRGEGPVADVRASAEYLRSVLRGTR